jgi:hypothetical protein
MRDKSCQGRRKAGTSQTYSPSLTLASHQTSMILKCPSLSINSSDGSVVRAPRKCVLANTSIVWCSRPLGKGWQGTFNRGDRGFDSYSLHSVFFFFFAPLTHSYSKKERDWLNQGV